MEKFTENGEFTYTYVTATGEEKTSTAVVNNINKPTEIEIEGCILENNLIVSIQPKTTYEGLIQKITCNKQYEIKEGNTVISGESKIKTGQVLIAGQDSYTLVVTGDTDGDGEAGIRDILQMNRHRLNKMQLRDANFQAGDVNKDGKVDIKDILQVNRYRLGKIKNL